MSLFFVSKHVIKEVFVAIEAFPPNFFPIFNVDMLLSVSCDSKDTE